ncbi:hypothetical protein BSKO_06062 [Bryopsis sp. KO-2023]|nr:hypothetical protein BSKO_06062 [Bryopsis sp. KO-2023]
MDERLFNRAFNRALNANRSDEDEAEPRVGPTEETAEPREPAAVILEALREKNYFRILGLELPTVDELGNPCWPCTSKDVSRAYRRISLAVHPDKNPTEEARKAFEAVNKAHRMLTNPGDLETILRDSTELAKRRKEELEARATVDERVTLNAQKISQQKKLQKIQKNEFEGEILRQVKSMRERSSKRKARQSTTRRKGDKDGKDFGEKKITEDEEDGGEAQSEPEEWEHRKNLRKQGAKKKKPKLIF